MADNVTGRDDKNSRQQIVGDRGDCSLCGGTHYGTGPYTCPFACSRCTVSVTECFAEGCPRNSRWTAEKEPVVRSHVATTARPDALANSLDAALGALDSMAFEENTTLAGTIKQVMTLGMMAVAELRKLPVAVSSIAPKTFAVYLVDGKPHRMCDCDTMKGDCPRGTERQLQTAQLSRCLVPVEGVLIVGQS